MSMLESVEETSKANDFLSPDPNLPPFSFNFDSMDRKERERETRSGSSHYESQFGPVPSRIEVEKAMGGLLRLLMGSSTSNSQTDGIQQIMMNHSDSRMIKSFGYQRIIDAFHLLQTDSSVQRMVVSISSDKAVWDAILKNKAVQDLQVSLNTAIEERPKSYKAEFDLSSLFTKWISVFTISKLLEMIEKFMSLVSDVIFQTAGKGKPTSELTILLEEKLRSSFLLSVVLLLIVVVTRIQEN